MHNIVATFCVADDVEWPKEKGVRSGYSPHHKFEAVEYLVSGSHVYGDNDLHYPGEMLTACITFPSWEYIHGCINVGDDFEVFELNRLVGYGQVQVISS